MCRVQLAQSRTSTASTRFLMQHSPINRTPYKRLDNMFDYDWY
jgi:hypothetical protein